MDRRDISFEQAEGAIAMPSQMEPGTTTPELRARIWSGIFTTIHASVETSTYGGFSYFEEPWNSILKAWWVNKLHRPLDEFPEANQVIQLLKAKFFSGSYLDFYGTLEFIIRRQNVPTGLIRLCEMVLSSSRSSYRIVDGSIIPLSSEEEAQALRLSLQRVEDAAANGPKNHLRAAIQKVSAGDAPGSIRESISAVEAAALRLEPSAPSLAPALSRLEKSIGLNPALKKAFGALYGFTSDEEGIRHALVFHDEANVSERDALFMLSACAAFVGYLSSAEKVVSREPAKN